MDLHADPRARDPADGMASFPDENPNPVLRIGWDGTLDYANRSSAPILAVLGVATGEAVPAELLDRLKAACPPFPPGPDDVRAASPEFDLPCGLRTFSILAVPIRGREAWNVYGTDVTGARVVAKFPDRNPHPVLRIDPAGTLRYANPASDEVLLALGIQAGDQLPGDLLAAIRERLDDGSDAAIHVHGGGRIFSLDPVPIPEFGFINLYGTDVTAMRAVTAFPDENPNPVLRVGDDGALAYANPASAPLLRAWGITVWEALPADLLDRLRSVARGPAPNVIEVEADRRLFAIRVVSLAAFESLNLYGSDVTAARDVEHLLHNILPTAIVDRIQGGEVLIADRFDEMAVLFADVVDFTPFAASHPPGEVVGMLNQVFSIFDHLTDVHRLEKIKTIGDAYMVAGGLSAEGGQAAELAEMALDMVSAMRSFRTADGAGLNLRVGLHVGPAIAGVIGLKKFIYDVWGNTVNTASRLESHGVPGRIHVTSETAALLADRYAFEPRGLVELKGKGPVETAFLIGRRA